MARSWFVVLTAALALGACKKKGGDAAGQAGAAAADSGGGIQAKLQPYIECLNRHSGRIAEVRGKYLEGVDPDKGPRPDKAPVMLGMYDIDQCVAGLAKARSIQPSVPELEKAGDAYAAALKQLAPVAKEAYDYYQQGNWKDDKAAKGIALHPKLMAAFDAFGKASHDLSHQVKALNRKAREDDLARREKAGVDLLVLTDRLMLDAEDLVAQCDVDATHLETVDVPALTAQIDKVEKQLAAVDAFASAHKDQVNKLGAFTSVTGEARQFLASTKNLMRRARDKKPFTGSDRSSLGTSSEWMVNGSPGEILRYYNEMVGAYNRM